MTFKNAKYVKEKFEPYKEPKKGSRVGRAKRSVKVGLLAMFAFFVTGMADQYLGIYTLMMGGIAMLDRLSGGVLVSKNFYMNLGLVALVCFAILKFGRVAGRVEAERKRKYKS